MQYIPPVPASYAKSVVPPYVQCQPSVLHSTIQHVLKVVGGDTLGHAALTVIRK